MAGWIYLKVWYTLTEDCPISILLLYSTTMSPTFKKKGEEGGEESRIHWVMVLWTPQNVFVG